MKRNRVIQFSLIISAVVLFFYTYYSNKEKIKFVDSDDNSSANIAKEIGKVTKDINNILENVSYNGTDNRGTFFKLNAELAEIYNDKPNLSNMKVVNAVISLKDGRILNINSETCVYDRLTNDAKFSGNVLVTESNNRITSDNLDLIMSENLITIYNNVKYNGGKGFLVADKVDIDILQNTSSIFMFDKKDKVKINYKN